MNRIVLALAILASVAFPLAASAGCPDFSGKYLNPQVDYSLSADGVAVAVPAGITTYSQEGCTSMTVQIAGQPAETVAFGQTVPVGTLSNVTITKNITLVGSTMVTTFNVTDKTGALVMTLTVQTDKLQNGDLLNKSQLVLADGQNETRNYVSTRLN